MHGHIRHWIRFQQEQPETAAHITELVLSTCELIRDKEAVEQIALLESDGCKELRELLRESGVALGLDDDTRAHGLWILTVAYFIIIEAVSKRS